MNKLSQKQSKWSNIIEISSVDVRTNKISHILCHRSRGVALVTSTAERWNEKHVKRVFEGQKEKELQMCRWITGSINF